MGWGMEFVWLINGFGFVIGIIVLDDLLGGG